MKISIVTTTYNSAATVKDTLESVLKQSHHDFEHIIVDGNSSDETLEIIKSYEPKYKGRLKYISEPDKGIYDAMNKGIRMATGEVVGILNSDDFYSSSAILACIANEIKDCDAVYGDIHFVKPEDLTRCVRQYSSRGFAPPKMKMGFMPAHPSFYCKRDIFDKVGLYDTSFQIAADFEFLLRAIYIKNISTKYIPIDFVTMRTGGASTSGLQSHKKILLEHLRAYRKNGVKSNPFKDSLRYAYKLGEQIKFKFSH